MKKRIISMILVVVMLVLSLASCGSFNYAKEDLGAYATLTSENKAALEAELLALLIKDADFGSDDETRAKKVVDYIYEILAESSTDKDKKTGVTGAHDLVKYVYYCTAEFEGKTEYFFMSNMKASSPFSLQLGKQEEGTKVEKAIAAALENLDLDGKTYSADTSTSTTVKEGDVVFLTYTYSYIEKAATADGEDKEVKGTVTQAMTTVGKTPIQGATPATIEEYISGKAVGTSITATTIKNADGVDVSYSGIKVEWVANGDVLTSFTAPYEGTETSVKNTEGKARTLTDKDLTYHVYVINYTAVSEFGTVSVLNELYGSGINFATVCTILFGKDYSEKEESELDELLKAYVTKDENGKDVSLENLVELIAKNANDLETAKSAVESAEKALTTAEDAVKTAEDTIKKEQDAGKEPTALMNDKLTKAKDDLEAAKRTLDDAKADLTKAEEKRDASIKQLTGIEGFNAKFEQGFKMLAYDSLQAEYDNEIKMNLAKEVYFLLNKYITVNAYPEKAVEENYKQMYESYENNFYTGSYDSSTSNYKKYGASLQNYIIATVTKNIKTVTTYDEAIAAMKEKAKEYVKPVIVIYVASKAYGVVAGEKEVKEYLDDINNQYNVDTYGENSVKYAYQFDLLMNHILKAEEKTEADANGYNKTTYTYSLIAYEIGEPKSEAKAEDSTKE